MGKHFGFRLWDGLRSFGSKGQATNSGGPGIQHLLTDDVELNLDIGRINNFDKLPLPRESEWYGIGRVVRELANLPADFPLYLQVHHGPCIEEFPMVHYDASPLPVLTCRDAFVKLHARIPGKTAKIMGTPQVLYRRLHNVVISESAQGTLAFPYHSSHHVAAVFDQERYAERLLQLPEEFQPVTVCVYWKDIMEGHHLAYANRGLRVVTAGHIADQDFTTRFYNHLRHFRYTTGNFTGSHSILSLEMGIPYFHSGPIPLLVDRTSGDPYFVEVAGGPGKQISADAIDRPIGSQVDNLLPKLGGNMEISPVLKQLVSYIHGCDRPLDGDDLRRFVIRAYFKHDVAGRVLHDLWITSRSSLDDIFSDKPDGSA
jgi:hypothetical protein